jgi:hypothetical protein
MNETNFADLFLATGGSLVLGALICLFAGTLGIGGLVAAVVAAYGVLAICNSMDRAEQRARK